MSSTTRTLPLELRLPNPPPVFVARGPEVLRLATLIERGPVTCIEGEHGIGKTALVLETFARQLPERAARTIFLRARRGEDVVPAVADALGALDDAAVSKTSAAVLEAAERLAACIVLDDVDRPAVDALLEAFRHYAARARLVIVSRRLDPPSTPEQRLVLGPLAEADLMGLARALWPSAPDREVARRAAAARGNPEWIRRLCSITGERRDPRAGERASVRALYEALFVIGAPLVERQLAECGLRVSHDDLARLVDRASLERLNQGFVLSAGAWASLDVALSPDERRDVAVRLASTIDGSRDVTLALASLQLLLGTGRLDAARAALEARCAEWLASGLAVELWRLLARLDDRSFDSWRLLVGLRVSEPDVLAILRLPDPATAQDRLRWAQCLLLRGELERAAAEARALREMASSDAHALTTEAAILEARCALNLNRMQDALAILARARPEGDPQRAHVGALRGSALVVLGHVTEGLGLAREAHRLGGSIGDPRRGEIARQVARALLDAGRPAEAEAVTRSVLAELDPGGVSVSDRGPMLLMHADASYDCGKVDEASRAVRMLAADSWAGRTSLLGFHIRGRETRIAWLRDEMGRVLEAALELVRDARGFGAVSSECLAAEVRLAAARALALPIEEGEDAVPAASPICFRQRLEVMVQSRRLRAGLETIEPDVHRDATDMAVRHDLLRAERRLVANDPNGALACVRDALGAARERGLVVLELECRALECDVIIVCGRMDELAPPASALAQLAAHVGSDRVRHEARFFEAAARKRHAQPVGALEQLAALGTAAPVASRRARAWLGGVRQLDAIDLLVERGLRAHAGWRHAEIVGAVPGDWEMGWGLDEQTRCVWFGPGGDVDLSDQPLLWRVLVALADAGGALDKERLVLRVWDEPRYDPRLHDNKVRLAMRKLRSRIEDDDASPARLLTSSEGYALGGSVRRLPAAPRHPT